MSQEVIKKISEARRELLDLGLRNSLLNYRPTKRRGIEITGERSADIFDLLVNHGKTMSFLGVRDAREAEQSGNEMEEETALRPLIKEDRLRVRSNALRDDWLQTSLSPLTLESKLLATHAFAKSHIEERGVNILFLALGMVYWTESEESKEFIKAPILLIPVELQRTTALEKFKLRYLDEEIEENISLKAKVLNDFRLKLPDFPPTDDIDVDSYLRSMRSAIAPQKGWTIKDDEIQLGLFSFGKYLLYKDLDPERWPEGRRLENNSLLRSILVDGFKREKVKLESSSRLDDRVTHDVLPQVIDADSTQLEAVLEVQQGNNIVIQGPPGTGKSQTITNIIANAIAGGKKVLFVSEKMAALEVVKRRLDSLGLGDACLELHSHKANKKDILSELKRTWSLGKPKVENWESKLSQYHEMRKSISAYLDAVTTQLPKTGYTPYQLIGEIVRERRNLSSIQIPTGIKFGPVHTERNEDARKALELIETQEYFTRHNLESYETLVQKLQQHIQTMGLSGIHPFRNCGLTILYESEKDTLLSHIKLGNDSVVKLISSLGEISTFMGLDSGGKLEDAEIILRSARRSLESPHLQSFNIQTEEWQQKRDDITLLLTWVRRYQEIHGKWDSVLMPEAWTADVLEARKTLQLYKSKWWRLFSGQFRRATKSLKGLYSSQSPMEPERLIEAADVILESRRLSRTIGQYEELGIQLFGVHWQSHSSDWQVLEKVSSWILALYAEIGSGSLPKRLIDFLAGNPSFDVLRSNVNGLSQSLDSYRRAMNDINISLNISATRIEVIGQQSLDDQRRYLVQMQRDFKRIQEIIVFNVLSNELRDLGLHWIIEVAEKWQGASTHLVNLFRKSWFEVLLQRAFEERKALRTFDSSSHDINIDKYKELDLKLLQHCRLLIAHKHFESMPFASGVGQVGILVREFEKKRRQMPIRQLLLNCGNAIQAMKPIYMMSPISVASFLAPESTTFDLVIFDEASQVKPVDALGAIVRSKQIVVVGDSKQLPPTSFFDAVAESVEDSEDDYEESVASDMESILSLLLAQGLSSRSLLWHYRSRHDSLIAVSNKEFYDNQLVVFPCPNRSRESEGLSFVHLPESKYDRGRTRTNQREAEAVAARVIEHARNTPHLTLGVAAFSLPQAEAIVKNVEIMRRQNPQLESFFAAHVHEPFFVKNLETVQGDERDVILISIGYGRTDNSDVIPMNFGALNKDGGERRLNVLITRARMKCEVFSSLTHGDIDLSKTQAKGVVALKSFLSFAESGSLETPHVSGRDSDSIFEDEVALCLRQNGIAIDQQVGSAGYFIDIAAIDPKKPGSYVLAIECDGASYHSSATARDRDRLRQQVLEGLGWRFHRIWSTDWYKNPEAEFKRLLIAYQAATAISATPKKKLLNPQRQNQQ